jgi:MoaA/NifB/PqqE/SkfB family radical SAM enzyme
MSRLVVELTNRCNLRCRHCFDQRHAATGELPLGIIEKLLADARACGITRVSFTGGEPTLHRHFDEIVRRCADATCRFSLVTNGSTFPRLYSRFLTHRDWFDGVTFSLDGAREATHDRLRGVGSYRQVMRAASICHFTGLGFTLNMVVTAENRDEICEMVDVAAALGSRGVRFGFLMPGHGVEREALELPPEERLVVEAVIRQVQQSAPIAVDMAPGYFSESPFFPCGPLEEHEFNVDWRGNMTLCCHLSGFWGDRPASPDKVANLHDMTLPEALSRFRQRVSTYLSDKRARVDAGQFADLDHFPCRYCVGYLDDQPSVVLVHRRPVTNRGEISDHT